MLTKGDERTVRRIVKEEISLETGPMKKGIAKILKDMRVLISLFDRDIVHLKKRADRVEKELKLPPLPTS